MTVLYDGSLETLFKIIALVVDEKLNTVCIRRSEHAAVNPAEYPTSQAVSCSLFRNEETFQGDLFTTDVGCTKEVARETKPEVHITALDNPDLCQRAQDLAHLLRTAVRAAYADLLHAWMSELPVEHELVDFAVLILRAGLGNKGFNTVRAEFARTNRGHASTQRVQAAAMKTRREYHRLIGLLRFKPSAEGPLVARCSPDHFVLPLFSRHFCLRFSSSSWAIMDEQRSLLMLALPPRQPYVASYNMDNPPFPLQEALLPDEIEALWRGYHQALCIESRLNPDLQRSLMPVRYWKYLVEV